MLILALAESSGRHEGLDVREKYQAIFNCQRIGTLVGETATAARQEDELAWQREQTTQWWETAQRLGARVAELEAHNTEIETSLSEEHEAHKRVSHELWQAKQEMEQAKLEMEQVKQEVEQVKQEMEQHKQEIEQVRLQLQHSEWEHSNLLAHYRGTWCFRVRQWAARLRDRVVGN